MRYHIGNKRRTALWPLESVNNTAPQPPAPGSLAPHVHAATPRPAEVWRSRSGEIAYAEFAKMITSANVEELAAAKNRSTVAASNQTKHLAKSPRAGGGAAAVKGSCGPNFIRAAKGNIDELGAAAGKLRK